MKENNETEKILLNDESYEKFISEKIEKEFTKELAFSKPQKSDIITDIKKAPKDRLFSKDAVYIVMNRKSKTKSYINGIQAESFLGTQDAVREKFLAAKINSFVSGDNYVKFYKLKV